MHPGLRLLTEKYPEDLFGGFEVFFDTFCNLTPGLLEAVGVCLCTDLKTGFTCTRLSLFSVWDSLLCSSLLLSELFLWSSVSSL